MWHRNGRPILPRSARRSLARLIDEEKLDDAGAREVVARMMEDRVVPETGTAIAAIMKVKPSIFAPAGAFAEAKARVVERLKEYLERFGGTGRA